MIEYGGVLIFMVISLVISIVLPLISYIIGIKKGDSEKLQTVKAKLQAAIDMYEAEIPYNRAWDKKGSPRK